MNSPVEDFLAMQLDALGINYEREYRAVPGRRYRWDFAILSARLLIEVQGGIWLGRHGAHSGGRGLTRDYRKSNLAVLHGWRVLFFSPDMVESGEALEAVKICLFGKD